MRPGYARRMLASVVISWIALAEIGPICSAASPRIVVLWQVGAPLEGWFRESMRELGYIDGKNISIEWRVPDMDAEKVRTLSAEIAASKPDIIVAGGTLIAKQTLASTQSIPVVFVSGDPVGTGLVPSLARPGGNATGLSSGPSDLTMKRLQLLHSIAPHAQRVIVLRNPLNPAQQRLEQMQAAAKALGISIETLDVSQTSDLDKALNSIPSKHAGAILISGEVPFFNQRTKIADAVRKARLPAMFPFAEYHDSGVLMSYGSSAKEMIRRMCIYVDKILKGGKPAELPVEQVSKVDFVIDLRVARELGIKVPEELLYRADRVLR